MCHRYIKKILFLSLLLFATLGFNNSYAALVKGIYLLQSTLEDTDRLNYLIQRAKKVGINTFVVDLDIPSTRYRNNIALIKSHDIHYVARIVIFPEGGTPEQVASEAWREKKYRLVEAAISYGANEIQLDYIRYKSSNKPSPENSKNIHKVISWFKSRVAQKNIPLQIDVFGISSFGESKYIGQNIKLFSETVDAICPMVYPSHYEPFAEHVKIPYETVYDSLDAIKEQFNDQTPFKLYAYIELSNYHYPMPQQKLFAYIRAQTKAVEDAKADGWYAWSAQNRYDNLFRVLEMDQHK